MIKYSLEELYRKGLINSSVIKYRDINKKLDEAAKMGMKKGEAVKYVARMAGCTIQTVYNARKLKLKF